MLIWCHNHVNGVQCLSGVICCNIGSNHLLHSISNCSTFEYIIEALHTHTHAHTHTHNENSMCILFLCFPDDDQDNDTREAEATREQSRLKELEGICSCVCHSMLSLCIVCILYICVHCLCQTESSCILWMTVLLYGSESVCLI